MLIRVIYEISIGDLDFLLLLPITISIYLLFPPVDYELGGVVAACGQICDWVSAFFH